MVKRVQHDNKKYVIPNLFRNLEFGNDNKLIAFVLIDNLDRKKFRVWEEFSVHGKIRSSPF